MLVKMRCVRKFNTKDGEAYSVLAPEFGKAINVKDKYQNVPLAESALYLVEVEARQKDGKAFLTFNVLAPIG